MSTSSSRVDSQDLEALSVSRPPAVQLGFADEKNSSNVDQTSDEREQAQESVPSNEATHPRRGLSFWLIFLGLCTTIFLSALDMAAVPTAQPVIIEDLNGTSSFAWIGGAYTLSASAWLPFSGSLANVIGRKPLLLLSLAFFAAGSAICGEAINMSMLIAGRVVQGIGNGGIMSCSEIIVADLVPLSERGLFMGFSGMTWSIASAAGPPLGGAFAQSASWRWLFRINLPLTFVAAVVVMFVMRLKMPDEHAWKRLLTMDWLGAIIVLASAVSISVALTRAGVEEGWSSASTVVPLVLGLVGLVGFLVFEAHIPVTPIVPIDLLSNFTSLAGYLGIFLYSLVVTAILYYLPVFIQASYGASPVTSGIEMFGICFSVAPCAIVGGILASKTKRYVPLNYAGWMVIIVGLGLLTLLQPSTYVSQLIGYEIILGIGLGIMANAPKFPVLAPLPVSRNATAMGLFSFLRMFAQIFGIAIGSAVLRNGLNSRVPGDIASLLPAGVDIAYAGIPFIHSLPEPARGQVQDAFASSLSNLWKVLLGLSGLALLAVPLMREVVMHTTTDEDWGINEDDGRGRINSRK